MNRDAAFDRSVSLLQGAHLARVVSIADPQSLNRVQVRLLAYDAESGQDAPLWARVVAPFAGDKRGVFFMPDVDDEVLVVFAGGDARHPLVVGGLWNGRAASPAALGSDGNRYKRIRSKNGITVTLDDQRGKETLTLETPGGQRLTLKDGPGSVTLEDANGNTVKLEAAGISIDAQAKVTVHGATVTVNATSVNVNTPMATFSAFVKCQTLITDSVVSKSYTPGIGNVW